MIGLELLPWLLAVMSALALLGLWRLSRIDHNTTRAADELEEQRRLAAELRDEARRGKR